MSDVSIWRQLLAGWNAIVGRFGFAQTLVILALFYALIIGPAAVVVTVMRRDLLDRRGLRADGTAWRAADSSEPNLERARHTF